MRGRSVVLLLMRQSLIQLRLLKFGYTVSEFAIIYIGSVQALSTLVYHNYVFECMYVRMYQYYDIYC